MKNDKYTGFKKLVAFLAAVGLWAVSMYFSYKGFEFEATEVLWFGVVLALVVTVVELVFNTKIRTLNPTLLAAGILCYIYGAYTNITGFYILQHGTLEGFFSGTHWLIPVFAGLLCEVLPEALFAWAIGSSGDGDLIGNVGEMFSSNSGEQEKGKYQPVGYGIQGDMDEYNKPQYHPNTPKRPEANKRHTIDSGFMKRR